MLLISSLLLVSLIIFIIFTIISFPNFTLLISEDNNKNVDKTINKALNKTELITYKDGKEKIDMSFTKDIVSNSIVNKNNNKNTNKNINTNKSKKDSKDSKENSSAANTYVVEIININIASKEKLMTLKGIGEKTAEAIISYRNMNGEFKSIEDIMNVPGIGQKKYNLIKASIEI